VDVIPKTRISRLTLPQATRLPVAHRALSNAEKPTWKKGGNLMPDLPPNGQEGTARFPLGRPGAAPDPRPDTGRRSNSTTHSPRRGSDTSRPGGPRSIAWSTWGTSSEATADGHDRSWPTYTARLSRDERFSRVTTRRPGRQAFQRLHRRRLGRDGTSRPSFVRDVAHPRGKAKTVGEFSRGLVVDWARTGLWIAGPKKNSTNR